jgi:hypothetical protein
VWPARLKSPKRLDRRAAGGRRICGHLRAAGGMGLLNWAC